MARTRREAERVTSRVTEDPPAPLAKGPASVLRRPIGSAEDEQEAQHPADSESRQGEL